MAEPRSAAGATLVNDVTALRASPRDGRADRARPAPAVPDAHARSAAHDAGRPATLRRRRVRGQALPRGADDLRRRTRGFRGEDHPRPRASASARPPRTTSSCSARLPELVALGRPILVRHEPQVLPRRSSPAARSSERLAGTIATNVIAYERGARIFRVHDVTPLLDALTVSAATLGNAQIL